MTERPRTPRAPGGLAATPRRRLAGADARRLLWRHHLRPGDLEGVLGRLGSLQYDPLAPLGRNVDLVLQARVPSYRIDDWQVAAYRQRLLVDTWDKQASLVQVHDWPMQAPFFAWFSERWRRHGIDPDAAAGAALREQLRSQGPATSLELGEQGVDPALRGSWYGPKRSRHLLRALWDSGRIVTARRVAGRHAYDLPERVLPAEVLALPAASRQVALERLVERRVQAAGMVRPGADASVWFLPCDRRARDEVAAALVAQGRIVPVEADGTLWWASPAALASLEAAPVAGVRFLAPLDPLLWDRAGVRSLHQFDYVWEVYKPAAARRWGYYVLPVAWRERFVARFDARADHGRLTIHAWYWEGGIDAARLPSGLADDLQEAALAFMRYLGAFQVRLPAGLGRAARAAWQAAARRAAQSA